MLPNQTPVRGDNSNVGDAKTPGTHAANVAQQRYFADVTTKSLLPMFKAAGGVNRKNPYAGPASPCMILAMLAMTVAEALLSRAFHGVIWRY